MLENHGLEPAGVIGRSSRSNGETTTLLHLQLASSGSIVHAGSPFARDPWLEVFLAMADAGRLRSDAGRRLWSGIVLLLIDNNAQPNLGGRRKLPHHRRCPVSFVPLATFWVAQRHIYNVFCTLPCLDQVLRKRRCFIPHVLEVSNRLPIVLVVTSQPPLRKELPCSDKVANIDTFLHDTASGE